MSMDLLCMFHSMFLGMYLEVFHISCSMNTFPENYCRACSTGRYLLVCCTLDSRCSFLLLSMFLVPHTRDTLEVAGICKSLSYILDTLGLESLFFSVRHFTLPGGSSGSQVHLRGVPADGVCLAELPVDVEERGTQDSPVDL